jgi:thermostable 8-oxoguanine DNA glycosylase
MSQEIEMRVRGARRKLILPDHYEPVLPGVIWGHHYATFTPAFWVTQAWLDQDDMYSNFRIGDTLTEEVAACLLGGYGIPAEVGLAAFYRVRDGGLLDKDTPSEEIIYQALSTPLIIGNRYVHYRFASQRSKYLSKALEMLADSDPPTGDDLAFRQWLLGFSGIGPKTASWITRNWLKSDRVAIIDIHIHRAGLLMGLYKLGQSPSKEYFQMEDRFLAFANCIGVKASLLDALIWRRMKDAGGLALKLIERIQTT